MFNWLRKVNILIMGMALVFVTNSVAFPEYSFAQTMGDDMEPITGSNILHGNCDPGADPLLDSTREEDHEKSCIGQDIDINNFTVDVHYKGDPVWGAVFGAIVCTPLTAGAITVIGYPACVAGIIAWVASIDETHTLELEGDGVSYDGFVTFYARLESDMACVYGYPVDSFAGFTAEKEGYYNDIDGDNASFTYYDATQEGQEVYNEAANRINAEKRNAEADRENELRLSRYNSLPEHCIYVPEPRFTLKPPNWSNLISPICTNYDSSASQFRYAPGDNAGPDDRGKNRSFIGVAVQCVEDTMMNIFTVQNDEGETFFTVVQERLQDFIRALLALYIIFFGYKFIIEREGIKSTEWHWFILKFGLVLYFAAGPGMSQLLPHLMNVTKEFSIIVMESTFGIDGDVEDAQSDLFQAEDSYNSQREKLVAARYEYAQAQYNLSKDPENADLQKIAEKARDRRDEAKNIADAAFLNYQDSLNIFNSFGYRYCDFRNIEADGGYIYEDTDPDGNPRVRDMKFMKLWDMMDCKITKYLGVGDYRKDRSAPQALVIAIGSLFSHILGLVLLLLFLVFLVFIILIILRVVHIYLMATISLILLVFISPLIIPTVLFGYFKKIFDKWLKFVIGYTVQPIMMFTFLAFLVAMYDMVIFGGNHRFIPMTQDRHVSENNICLKSIETDQFICDAEEDYSHPKSDLECEDKDTLGCVYRTTEIEGDNILFGIGIFEYDLDDRKAKMMLIELLKLLLISFIAYAVLGLVESMLGSMTDTRSAADSSDVTVASPDKAVNAFYGAGKKAGKAGIAAGQAGVALGKAAKGRKKRNEINKNAKNAKRAGMSAKVGGGKGLQSSSDSSSKSTGSGGGGNPPPGSGGGGNPPLGSGGGDNPPPGSGGGDNPPPRKNKKASELQKQFENDAGYKEWSESGGHNIKDKLEQDAAKSVGELSADNRKKFDEARKKKDR